MPALTQAVHGIFGSEVFRCVPFTASLSFEIVLIEESESAQYVNKVVYIFFVALVPEKAHSCKDLSGVMCFAGQRSYFLSMCGIHISGHAGKYGCLFRVLLGFIKRLCKGIILNELNVHAVFIHLSDYIAQRQSMVIDRIEDAARLRCTGKFQKCFAGTVDRSHADLIFYHAIREAAKQGVSVSFAHHSVSALSKDR